MPFDPTKPANNSPLVAAEMMNQLNTLNQSLGNVAQSANLALSSSIAGTSSNSNSNGVSLLSQSASGSYDQAQLQTLFDKLDADKLDELITTLRR